jgi:hypothetical protein
MTTGHRTVLFSNNTMFTEIPTLTPNFIAVDSYEIYNKLTITINKMKGDLGELVLI